MRCWRRFTGGGARPGSQVSIPARWRGVDRVQWLVQTVVQMVGVPLPLGLRGSGAHLDV